MLHLTTGDVNAERIREAGLPGHVVVHVDVLHEGPAPLVATAGEWSAVRARFISECGWATRDAAVVRLAEADDAIAGAAAHDEVVIWAEHDLLCQLAIIRMLDALAERPARISLVAIGAYPGVDRFRGLADLNATRIRALFDARPAATPEAITLARRAWRAFRAPDPREIERLAGETPALPYLGPALRRHVEEFPSVEQGLSRTERQALDALATEPLTRRRLFVATQAREDVPFMGDLAFFARLDGLGNGPTPLVTRDGEEVTLTGAGRAVLDGRADAVALRGIDRWVGGVHLTARPGLAPSPIWRWSGRERRLMLA